MLIILSLNGFLAPLIFGSPHSINYVSVAFSLDVGQLARCILSTPDAVAAY